MEKKNGLSKIVIVFLIFVIGGLLGYIACDKLSNDKSEPKEETSNKTESNSNVTTSNTQEQTTNSYEIFAKGLKEQIKKYNDNNGNAIGVEDGNVGGYTVSLTANGELYIEYYDKAVAAKFGKAKISDKVLSFYLIETGNGGINTLYFINEDGTVSTANIEEAPTDGTNKITVKKVEGYTNIVSIVQGVFAANYSGGGGAIFIDINGNVYNPNLK